MVPSGPAKPFAAAQAAQKDKTQYNAWLGEFAAAQAAQKSLS
ncbi:hypothetical protein CZ787_10705 [Halomonas citrativorans]|uniref:Uncharacterized protein n=1 Tax=Halomonas citrativorans TaxID=2742612 RepID=A0A1R4I1D3_9GAMM|nr:hypothetical protein CZ787_10705 [Halomonas citrativorans]